MTTPDEPVTTPDEPVTTPDEPVTTPDEPATTPDEMVVVTGAAGFIGSHLVRALVDRGARVRALVHREQPMPQGVDAVVVDLPDGDVTEALAGATVVFHLAGPYRGSAATLARTHVAGTAAVVAATPRDARFVYVSSTSVYGWDQVWPADERSPVAPCSAYGHAKAAAEQRVRERVGPSVIVRPTIVYGPGDERGMLPRTVRLLRRGVRVVPGDGRNRVHLLHVSDCVEALITVGLGPMPPSPVYVLCGPAPTSLRDAIGWVAEGADLEPPRWGRVPTGAARRLASVTERAWEVAGRDGEAPLTVHSVDVATRDRAYSSALAARELAWVPAVAPADGLRALGESSRDGAAAVGFDWRGYFTDPDEGLGTVYERFGLDDILEGARRRTAATSVLHAPAFGMMGIPGLDAALLAQRGVRVGVADTDAERLEAVVGLWERLGLAVEPHLLATDPAQWPEDLGSRYDLVFSFAALWWFEDPWQVVRAQARWADRALVTSVPNKNVFMRMRAAFWHRRLFDELNEDALDTDRLAALAPSLGMRVVDQGLFDLPPFPDTSVPLAKVLRAFRGRTEASDDSAWAWSILPYLEGEADDLPGRIERIGAFERHFPRVLAPAWAHHRYVVMERGTSSHSR
ncbi:MAG: NAD-dependent epimerase/dehydratase family protein [Acidimicrobiales bacterium]